MQETHVSQRSSDSVLRLGGDEVVTLATASSPKLHLQAFPSAPSIVGSPGHRVASLERDPTRLQVLDRDLIDSTATSITFISQHAPEVRLANMSSSIATTQGPTPRILSTPLQGQ